MSESNNELKPVTWDEIKKFYKDNFNETLPEDWREAFCYAWSISRKMPVIDLLTTGYRAAQQQAKIDFAAKYDHKSPLQVIAAEYVKRRGTTGPLALMEENRFIDGYEAGLHASNQQWISVKDELPPPQTEVLWWNKAANQAGVSSWEYMSHCDDTMIEWGDAGNVSIKNFTHWMPLPTPPEGSKT